MVDDKVDGQPRIDMLRRGTMRLCRVPHGRQVDHDRHTQHVLQQDTRGQERNRIARLAMDDAFRTLPILAAQDVLQEHAQAVGQTGEVCAELRTARCQIDELEPALLILDMCQFGLRHAAEGLHRPNLHQNADAPT